MWTFRHILRIALLLGILSPAMLQCRLTDPACAFIDGSCAEEAQFGLLALFLPAAEPVPEPLPVADSHLWLLSEYGLNETGGRIIIWEDFSGTNTHAIAPGGSGAFLKTDVLNGRPVLNFDGTSSNYTMVSNYIFSPAANGGITIIAVCRSDHTDGSSDHNLYDFGFFANAGYGLRYSSDSGGSAEGSFYTPSDGNGTNMSFDVAANTSEFVILTAKAIFLTEMRVYINGTSIADTPTNLTELTADTIREQPLRADSPGGPVSIGFQSKDPNASRTFAGDLAELIVYTRALPDTDRALVECYLSGKYGLSVSHACN